MIPPLFPKSAYAKRRNELLENLDAGRDLVIFFTAPVRYRNHDSAHRFRGDSSFLYLTGFAEERSVALLWKEVRGAKTQSVCHLFVRPRNVEREQWDGFRYGPEGAKENFGVQAAFEIEALDQHILDWLAKKPSPGRAPRIFTNANDYPEHKVWLDKVLDRFAPPHRSKVRPIESVHDIGPHVQQLRLIKSPAEIALMKRAGEINVQAHLKVMQALKPGLFEYEMQAVVEYEYQRHGCIDPSYTTISAGGANATILHYVENDQKLRAGDMYLIDAGCEYQTYASDITRTLPVSGKFSEQQRLLMDIVADALAETQRVVRPGLRFSKLHETAEAVLVEGLLELKILKGTKKQIFESNSHRRYYPHGTSHWLGLDVHDACPYLDAKGDSLKLEPGMVFTIEPGLYFMQNDETVAKEWRGLGIRIEDDVVVTKTGCQVLTDGLPRRAAEIEKEMARRRR